jgi:hypothetical protein
VSFSFLQEARIPKNDKTISVLFFISIKMLYYYYKTT